MDIHVHRRALQRTTSALVILLDTNALIWIDQDHHRTRGLTGRGRRLYISPASLLELQFLLEAGRVRLHVSSVSDIVDKHVWLLDDPPATAWFDAALALSWTRDPFDRLLVAHARLRGWRLATADTTLLAHLPDRERLAL